MVAPWAWAASPSTLPPAFILRDGGFGISQTRKLPGLHSLDIIREGLCFLNLGRCIGLRLLLGQLTRMHDHKTQGCLGHLALTVFDLHLSDDALPTPTSTRFILGTPGFFHQEGQGRL